MATAVQTEALEPYGDNAGHPVRAATRFHEVLAAVLGRRLPPVFAPPATTRHRLHTGQIAGGSGPLVCGARPREAGNGRTGNKTRMNVQQSFRIGLKIKAWFFDAARVMAKLAPHKRAALGKAGPLAHQGPESA